MADRELSSAPSILPLLVRAAFATIPGAGRLPFVGGGGGAMPDRVLTLSEVEIERDRLAAYNRICGFGVGDRLPATYPHMLAFPLHLALMTDGSFPFAAIGLVHIANRIVQLRPMDADERLSLRVWATEPQHHARGQQFSIRSQARVGEELVWEEVSTNLRRERDGEPSSSRAGPRAPSGEGFGTSGAAWRLAGDLGRRYGAISGDLNPIHVHPLTARLFGYPTAIAHGMWTKARCLAALGRAVPDAFTVQVAFKRPILLPATVCFGEARTDGVIEFDVRDAEHATPHLEGQLEYAPG